MLFCKVFAGQVHVYLGHVHVGVAHHLLQGERSSPIAHEAQRKAMPERIWRNLDAQFPRVVSKPVFP